MYAFIDAFIIFFLLKLKNLRFLCIFIISMH